MSTRCQIGFFSRGREDIDNPQALIYRHSDGYPSAVLPDLLSFGKWWEKARGLSDVEYFSARFLQFCCNEYDGQTADYEGKPQSGLTGVLGYGISLYIHGDIEFYYAVDEEGVEVLERDYALEQSAGHDTGEPLFKTAFIILWKDVPTSVDGLSRFVNNLENMKGVLNG